MIKSEEQVIAAQRMNLFVSRTSMDDTAAIARVDRATVMKWCNPTNRKSPSFEQLLKLYNNEPGEGRIIVESFRDTEVMGWFNNPLEIIKKELKLLCCNVVWRELQPYHRNELKELVNDIQLAAKAVEMNIRRLEIENK